MELPQPSRRISGATLECMKAGVSLAEIGRRIGRARCTVSLMFSGRRPLHPDVLPTITELSDELTARRVARAIQVAAAGRGQT